MPTMICTGIFFDPMAGLQTVYMYQTIVIRRAGWYNYYDHEAIEMAQGLNGIRLKVPGNCDDLMSGCHAGLNAEGN